ncbi:MAG TPA: PH domain-containing protein, partial [Propionibacteriaceae bacterium]|nr:PH domain-containing protein [Propionibacteriaceae bacterium]
RPHPLTPFVRGWLVFVAIAIGWGREIITSAGENQFQPRGLLWILPVLGIVVLLAAIAGFFSWYFTRFVIDDEELRIETGAIFKKSTKIPFERLQSVDIVQPLAARIFGLAELRLDAGNSTTKLRYLTRSKASRFRDYLLTRAQGHQASIRDLDQQSVASVFTDLGMNDQPLVQVTPQRLIFSFLVSTEWLIPAAISIIIFVGTMAFEMVPLALGALIPLLIGMLSLIWRRVIGMFNFTLAESPRGLRITRGLTNLTSQSVPINRVQGAKTSQPLLWKPFGWYRVDIDILGHAQDDGENSESTASSVLLPVASTDQVELALGRVLPGFDLDGIALRTSPKRARWLRWFDFWTLRYGWDDRMLITEQGWFTHVRDMVPHAKTQSVRIEQGPLQRLLRLADVHVHTPRGPVNAVAHQLDEQIARELALSQLDRARAARAAEREHHPVQAVPADDHQSEHHLLAAFGTGRDHLLGSGGESEVFALDHDRVLRLYRARHERPQHTAAQLRSLYDSWRDIDIGIELPMIIDMGQHNGRFYTVDRRFSGRNFSTWLQYADMARRRPALISFLDATEQLQRLPSPAPGFAHLIGDGAPQQFSTLAELLATMLQGPLKTSRARLEHDVPRVSEVWQRLHADLAQRDVAPALVHGDVCPPNAYISQGTDGPVVTGIGDFSPHTLNADPLMDVAGALIFLELEPYADAAADAAWLEAVAVERHGRDIVGWIDVYRRYYGFYFSNTYAFEPAVYAWCIRQLSR